MAAVDITVPTHRLAKDNIDQLGRLVMKVAETISDDLGYGDLKSKFVRRSERTRTDFVET